MFYRLVTGLVFALWVAAGVLGFVLLLVYVATR